MEPIKEFIHREGFGDKELWLFNSHFHWDHIWGNCAFDHPTIVAPKLCKVLMADKGKEKLKEKSEYQMGEVTLALPTVTFDETLELITEKIEFKHMPSHTEDSAVCIDYQNSVMYVGDVVEFPLPFVMSTNLERYIEILEQIKSIAIDTIISSHSGIVSEKLIDKNIEYIKDLKAGKTMTFKDELSKIYHQYNQEFLNKKTTNA
jgi:glyoxylase-like metal-dependent hydrolase (beta-lactamase superfamily II)